WDGPAVVPRRGQDTPAPGTPSPARAPIRRPKALTVKKLSHRPQRTLARPAEVSGVGFLTGATVRLRSLPAPPDAGVVFVRTALRTTPRIPTTVRNVTGTQRPSTPGHAPRVLPPVDHAQ